MTAAHEFALFIKQIPAESSMRITDNQLLHRMRTVLRAHSGQHLVLFSYTHKVRARIELINDRECRVALGDRLLLAPLKPIVDLVIPTLERAALEEAVRAATIGGVQRIIITRTQKSAPLRIMRDRLTRCMIAAAEQSKQYCLPEIIECSDFDTAISKKSTMLFFHPTGSPLRDLFPVLESADPLTVVIGPAGDFTADEYDLLITKGACIARLTPTILRSEDAVMVGIGVVRSAL